MSEPFRLSIRDWQLGALLGWAKEQVGLGTWGAVIEELREEAAPCTAVCEERFARVEILHGLLASVQKVESLQALVRANGLNMALDTFWSYLVRTDPQRLLPFLLGCKDTESLPQVPAWVLTIGDPEASLSRQDEVALLPADPEILVLALLRRLELTAAVAPDTECLEGRRLEKGVLLEVNVQKVTAAGRPTNVRTSGRVRLLDAAALLAPRERKAPATSARVTLYRPRRAAALDEVLSRLVRDALEVLENSGRPSLAAGLRGRVEELPKAFLLDAAEGSLLALLSGYVRLELFPD